MKTTELYPKIESIKEYKPHTYRAVRMTNPKYFNENTETEQKLMFDRNDPTDKGRVEWDESSHVLETHFFGSVKIEFLEKTQNLVVG